MARYCVGCKHWYFDSGSPDLSDVTFGDEWESGCKKSHWELQGHYTTEAAYRDKLKTAANCSDFSAVDEII